MSRKHSGFALGSVVSYGLTEEGEERIETAGLRYLERNPEAKNWMHCGDFKFFQMKLIDVYFVAGFGVMGWISDEEFKTTQPDPLAPFSDDIIQQLNDNYRDSMVLIAKDYSQLDAVDAEIILAKSSWPWCKPFGIKWDGTVLLKS